MSPMEIKGGVKNTIVKPKEEMSDRISGSRHYLSCQNIICPIERLPLPQYGRFMEAGGVAGVVRGHGPWNVLWATPAES